MVGVKVLTAGVGRDKQGGKVNETQGTELEMKISVWIHV